MFHQLDNSWPSLSAILYALGRSTPLCKGLPSWEKACCVLVGFEPLEVQSHQRRARGPEYVFHDIYKEPVGNVLLIAGLHVLDVLPIG